MKRYYIVTAVALFIACGGTTTTSGTASSTTGSTTSTMASGGGATPTTTTASSMTQSCEAIEAAYIAAVQAAKACDSRLDGPQCTLKVAGDLVCGCEVFINPDNFDSVQVDADLKVYQDMGCQQPSPCDCAGAIAGTCTATGDGDVCETTFG